MPLDASNMDGPPALLMSQFLGVKLSFRLAFIFHGLNFVHRKQRVYRFFSTFKPKPGRAIYLRVQNEPAALMPGLDMETERVPLICHKIPGIKRHTANIELSGAPSQRILWP